MNVSTLTIVLISVAAGVFGAVSGYFVAAFLERKRVSGAIDRAQKWFDEVAAERDSLADRCNDMQAKIGALKSKSANYRSELEGALGEAKTLSNKLKTVTEQAKTLGKSVRALKAERETTKRKIHAMQDNMVAVHERASALQNEFEKAGAFYKRELLKSFNKRKQLEQDIKAIRAEQEAFNKRIEASVDEHGSAEEMIKNAQLRLGQIEMLERSVERLKTEKAEVLDDMKQLRAENEGLQNELSELVELRIHNQQLVQAIESLEQSRRKHEQEADQARSKAEESEQLSDTLSMKLADLEKGFAAMEQEQNEAIQHVRDAAASARPGDHREPVEYPEKYDLIDSSRAG